MTMPDKNIIALIYDFDGTLSPQPMQEYTVLPKIGVEPAKFWADVTKETHAQGGEDIITYMRMMYEQADAAKVPFTRDDLKEMGKDVPYFTGVESWFDRIDAYVAQNSDKNVETRHYIISSGLKEILEGVSIYDRFHNVFASEYYFDHYGHARYPNRVITDTTKTQYLFRINKGKEDLALSINDHMPEAQRPIPFGNMIYFGDGLTDVPSMAVTRANGGYAVAVHTPRQKQGHQDLSRSCSMKSAATFYAAADYSENSDLDRRTKLILNKVIANILLATKRTGRSEDIFGDWSPNPDGRRVGFMSSPNVGSKASSLALPAHLLRGERICCTNTPLVPPHILVTWLWS